ncbi:hypothetical protein C8R44DRAFT_738877 [Mycena epipterygia]|nr:hypothetical protein C8R44DRAFT_738877 [Mycena epipterygia]
MTFSKSLLAAVSAAMLISTANAFTSTVNGETTTAVCSGTYDASAESQDIALSPFTSNCARFSGKFPENQGIGQSGWSVRPQEKPTAFAWQTKRSFKGTQDQKLDRKRLMHMSSQMQGSDRTVIHEDVVGASIMGKRSARICVGQQALGQKEFEVNQRERALRLKNDYLKYGEW